MAVREGTALVLDLLREDHGSVRQIVLVRNGGPAADLDKHFVLSRTLTPDATGRHWKRHPVGLDSLIKTDGTTSWLGTLVASHAARGYSLSAAFVVENTTTDWDELSRGQTPRALMIRIDRSRDSVGAGTFTAQPSCATASPGNAVAEVDVLVAAWHAMDAPAIAPAGRARSGSRTEPENTAPTVAVPTAVPTATAPTTPVPATVKVAPGDKIVHSDGSVYVARAIDGTVSDVQMLRDLRAADLYALLYSLPGTGKTAAYRAAFGDELITLVGTSDSEVSDLVGTYVPTSVVGEYRWVDGPLTVAMDTGSPLLVDEAFLIDPRVLSVLYSAIDGRREVNITSNPARGTVKAKPGFWVGFAANPNVPGARVSDALLSRCSIQLEYTTDFDAMQALGVNRTLVVAARNLNKKRLSDEISTSPQARELLGFMRAEKIFGLSVALRNLIASAAEQDRDLIKDVLERAFGKSLSTLSTV